MKNGEMFLAFGIAESINNCRGRGVLCYVEICIAMRDIGMAMTDYNSIDVPDFIPDLWTDSYCCQEGDRKLRWHRPVEIVLIPIPKLPDGLDGKEQYGDGTEPYQLFLIKCENIPGTEVSCFDFYPMEQFNA